MMTAKKHPQNNPAEAYDPYAIRDFAQLMQLPDGGDFLKQFQTDHNELMGQLRDHVDEFGIAARGSFQINFSYALGTGSDLAIEAKASFTPPKKPSSKGAAYLGNQGEMTLYSPMMKKMHAGVRDVTPHDPDTGEVRDI